jgi:hypothetical protein
MHHTPTPAGSATARIIPVPPPRPYGQTGVECSDQRTALVCCLPRFHHRGGSLLQSGIVGVATCGVQYELSVTEYRSLVRIRASISRLADAGPAIMDILGCTR